MERTGQERTGRPRDGPVGAVVLAAGYSSRIGRPKPLLPLPGGTVLSRVIGTCREAGLDPIRVVVGHRGGEIASHIGRAPVGIVWNDRYPDGQTSSLQAGFRALPPTTGGAVLLYPVDYPAVDSGVIRALVAAYRAEGTAHIYLPTFEGQRGHPFLIDLSIRGEFLALPPGTPGRSVVRRDPARVHEVPVGTDAVLHDLDSPGDYARLRARLRA
jgi:CTP:molybdopterin cytidylyltransferase MocA